VAQVANARTARASDSEGVVPALDSAVCGGEVSFRLHPRHTQVARAKCDIQDAVAVAWKSHDLTVGELVSVLVSIASEHTKFVLRAERHPDDPNKKADEA